MQECLKNALLDHRIVSAECAREVVQIIEETEVDIDADPLLERACALDLLKYCKELQHGAGRRKFEIATVNIITFKISEVHYSILYFTLLFSGLKCLKIILNDSTRKLEPECEKELSSRLEMYRYVAAVRIFFFYF